MREVLQEILKRGRSTPDRPAVVDGDGVVSYGQLIHQVSALGEWAESLPSVVGVAGGKSVKTIVLDLALTLAGRTVVPLPVFFSGDQLGHLASDCGLEAIVCGAEEEAGRFAHLAPVMMPCPGSSRPWGMGGGHRRVIYTSGTTGHPKGVILGERQLGASVVGLARAANADAGDRALTVLPYALLLEQISGIYVPLFAGATIILCPSPQDLPHLAWSQQATTTVLVPEMLSGWVNGLEASGRKAPSSLRFVAVGGAPVPPRVAERAWQAGIPVHEGYGLSECGSVVAFNPPGRRRAGTVGTPLPGVQVSIVNGEIVVSGDTVMDGYMGRPLAERRWRTGDAGCFDEDGNLVVKGRLDDVIVTSEGRNIHPEWIESMLLADPRIGHCAAVSGGNRPLVVLVPPARGGEWLAEASPQDVSALVAELCVSAPDYARPGEIRVMQAPALWSLNLMTTNGRLRRKAIASYVKENS